jgi:hypothetical protein
MIGHLGLQDTIPLAPQDKGGLSDLSEILRQDELISDLTKNTNADLYIVGHWEDFFDNHGKPPPRISFGIDQFEFVTDLNSAIIESGDESQWLMPSQGKVIRVTREEYLGSE